MKLKMNDEGHVVVDGDKPVFVKDDGTEVPVDVPSLFSAITTKNGESQRHREAKEAAEAALKKFEGIENPEDALKALETVKNLDDKKLVDAGEVEAVKQAAIEAAELKFQPTVEENAQLKSNLNKEVIGGAFARSEFVNGSLLIPADMAQNQFGGHFSVSEDGKLLSQDQNGNQIYSASNPGDPASFDEAIAQLVNAYPGKDKILRGANQSGSDTKSGTNGGGSQGKKWSEMSGQEKVDLKKSNPEEYKRVRDAKQ